MEQEHKCWTVSPTAYHRNIDKNDTYFAVHFQKPPKRTEQGTAISLVIPTLLVTQYISDGEAIAQQIADLLNAHWPTGGAA
jgi:hypothetical protein